MRHLYQTGSYVPLETTGPDASHLFSFVIGDGPEAILVAVPRLVRQLLKPGDRGELCMQADAAVVLPDEWVGRAWTNAFSGVSVNDAAGRIPFATLFQDFPVALLRCGQNQ